MVLAKLIREPRSPLIMQASIIGIVEMSLVFGSLLAFLIWELYSVRKSQRRDEKQTRMSGKQRSGD